MNKQSDESKVEENNNLNQQEIQKQKKHHSRDDSKKTENKEKRRKDKRHGKKSDKSKKSEKEIKETKDEKKKNEKESKITRKTGLQSNDKQVSELLKSKTRTDGSVLNDMTKEEFVNAGKEDLLKMFESSKSPRFVNGSNSSDSSSSFSFASTESYASSSSERSNDSNSMVETQIISKEQPKQKGQRVTSLMKQPTRSQSDDLSRYNVKESQYSSPFDILKSQFGGEKKISKMVANGIKISNLFGTPRRTDTKKNSLNMTLSETKSGYEKLKIYSTDDKIIDFIVTNDYFYFVKSILLMNDTEKLSLCKISVQDIVNPDCKLDILVNHMNSINDFTYDNENVYYYDVDSIYHEPFKYVPSQGEQNETNGMNESEHKQNNQIFFPEFKTFIRSDYGTYVMNKSNEIFHILPKTNEVNKLINLNYELGRYPYMLGVNLIFSVKNNTLEGYNLTSKETFVADQVKNVENFIVNKDKILIKTKSGNSLYVVSMQLKLMKKESKPNYHSIKQFGSLITLVGEKNTEIISEDLITIAKQSLSKKDCKITSICPIFSGDIWSYGLLFNTHKLYIIKTNVYRHSIKQIENKTGYCKICNKEHVTVACRNCDECYHTDCFNNSFHFNDVCKRSKK